MKMYSTFLIFLCFNICGANAQLDGILNKAKSKVLIQNDEETGMGLKEALDLGVREAVNFLSAENGYLESPYKIIIPEDAQKIVNTVEKLPGFGNVEQELIKKMNRAAELAATKATPIFSRAIKQMTFKDATNILFGKEDAATRYLENTSRKSLYDEFMPIIQESLDEVNAREFWKSVVDAYNNIPLTRKINPQLDDHVNNKALDGLFALIQEKEKGIRTDVNQRTSPLLKKVFGRLN